MQSHEIYAICAKALLLLPPGDRKLVAWEKIPRVVATFLEKRTRITNVREAVKYTLVDTHIKERTCEEFTAWARLLNKVEYEVGSCVKEGSFAPIEDRELLAAMAHLREDPRYSAIVPPDDLPRVDFFALRAMASDIDRRRTSGIKLMLLTGTIVRDFVPDTTKERQHLGNACKSAFNFIYGKRKKWKTSRSAAKQTDHPTAPDPQFRLV